MHQLAQHDALACGELWHMTVDVDRIGQVVDLAGEERMFRRRQQQERAAQAECAGDRAGPAHGRGRVGPLPSRCSTIACSTARPARTAGPLSGTSLSSRSARSSCPSNSATRATPSSTSGASEARAVSLRAATRSPAASASDASASSRPRAKGEPPRSRPPRCARRVRRRSRPSSMRPACRSHDARSTARSGQCSIVSTMCHTRASASTASSTAPRSRASFARAMCSRLRDPAEGRELVAGSRHRREGALELRLGLAGVAALQQADAGVVAQVGEQRGDLLEIPGWHLVEDARGRSSRLHASVAHPGQPPAHRLHDAQQGALRRSARLHLRAEHGDAHQLDGAHRLLPAGVEDERQGHRDHRPAAQLQHGDRPQRVADGGAAGPEQLQAAVLEGGVDDLEGARRRPPR